ICNCAPVRSASLVGQSRPCLRLGGPCLQPPSSARRRVTEAAPEFLIAADLLGPSEADSAWRREARPQQLAPAGDWFVWLIMAGRGWGKTRTGAEWLAHRALSTPGDYAVIGRSTQDTRETAIEGTSGLLRALGLDRNSRDYNKANGVIRLPNGSTI